MARRGKNSSKSSSMLITCARRGIRTPRKEWVLALMPESHNEPKNEKIFELLTDMMSEHEATLQMMLDYDNRNPESMSYFTTDWKYRVPSYVMFKRALDRLDDNNTYEDKLAKLEEDILFNSNYDRMHKISEEEDIDDNEARRFKMKSQLGSMLSKRHKKRDPVVVINNPTNNTTNNNVFASFKNSELKKLMQTIEHLPEGEVIEVQPKE